MSSAAPWAGLKLGKRSRHIFVMNTKPNGTHNEHRSILLLESAGYACTRVAASLGIFDVIGTGLPTLCLVQCKTRDWPGSVEMEAIRNFQCPPLYKKIIHLWRDPARLPDVRTICVVTHEPGHGLPSLILLMSSRNANSKPRAIGTPSISVTG